MKSRRHGPRSIMRVRSLYLVALALCLSLKASAADVRVWQDVLTLPTYQEGPPDPNPPFDQFAAAKFSYPYTLRENITDARVDTAWRAVYQFAAAKFSYP